MSENPVPYGIITQDPFEYKLLLRLRQLRPHHAVLLINLDTEELQVCGRVESLNAKTMSATVPVASIAAS